MRQTISGLITAIAVMSAAPAMACGGLFGGCSPCGQAYDSPCAQPQVYVAPVERAYTGCGPCGGWAHEQLPEPAPYYSGRIHQYYYVNQGPTYTGPGDWAPAPTYQEGAGYGDRIHPHFRAWHHTGYRYYGHRVYHHGYGVRHAYAPRGFYGHHSLRDGARMGGPRAYSYHEHMMHEHMRRYN
jgi:hypothetical protein